MSATLKFSYAVTFAVLAVAVYALTNWEATVSAVVSVVRWCLR